MRTALAATFLLAMVAPAIAAEQLVVPNDQKEAFQKAAMSVAFADQCDKRLDKPEMLKDAKAVFLEFAQRINLPDAAGVTERYAKALADAPVEKDTSNFTLFNEKMCGDLARSLKAKLRK